MIIANELDKLGEGGNALQTNMKVLLKKVDNLTGMVKDMKKMHQTTMLQGIQEGDAAPSLSAAQSMAIKKITN